MFHALAINIPEYVLWRRIFYSFFGRIVVSHYKATIFQQRGGAVC